MNRLSGDQKGRLAPSVPGSTCAVSEPSGWTQMRLVPVESVALYAMVRPSGEMRGESWDWTDVGAVTRKRSVCSDGGGKPK